MSVNTYRHPSALAYARGHAIRPTPLTCPPLWQIASTFPLSMENGDVTRYQKTAGPNYRVGALTYPATVKEEGEVTLG